MSLCPVCGNEISDDSECVNCKFKEDPFKQAKERHHAHVKQNRSKAWIILPIIFGILGGIIALIVIWKDDKTFAKICLIVGILSTVIGIGLSLLFTPLF